MHIYQKFSPSNILLCLVNWLISYLELTDIAVATDTVHVLTTDQKAPRRKIQPVVWDKGSQSAATGISTTARGTKLKRGDASRRGKYFYNKQ